MASSKRKGEYLDSPPYKLIHTATEDGSLVSPLTGIANENIPTGSETSELVDYRIYDQISTAKIKSPAYDEATHHKKGGVKPTADNFMKKFLKDSNAYWDHYTSLKFKNVVYHKGDAVLVRNDGEVMNDFIGKILRIIRPKVIDQLKICGVLEVQWYYRKSDLPHKKYENWLKGISDNEVFLSGHKDFIVVDTIQAMSKVLSESEYDKLVDYNYTTFFTRASYDPIKRKLDPPIESWTKHCLCSLPMNPDLQYIQCDKCKDWYHMECVQMDPSIAEKLDFYECPKCKKIQEETPVE